METETKMSGSVHCFVHRFPPEVTGAGQQLKRVAEGLARRGMKMKFLTLGKKDAEERTESGLEVRRFRAERNAGTWSEVRTALRILRWISRERGKMRALQICGLSRVSYALLVWARAAGVPVVYRAAMFGGDEPEALRRERFGAWKVWQLGKADAVVVTTPRLEASFQAAFPGKEVWRIPNGVDCEEFRPAANERERAELREELGLRAEAKVIVTSGVACARKRTDFLLQAVAGVNGEAGDVQFVHLGAWGEEFAEEDARYRRVLEGIVARMAPGRMRVVGHTGQVAEYLRAADVFLFASAKEGCPNAVLEAMASGLPVVMTRLESVGEFLVRDGSEGVIVRDANDEEGFGRVVTELLAASEARRRMGESARKRAGEEFSMEKAVGKYEAMYRVLGVE